MPSMAFDKKAERREVPDFKNSYRNANTNGARDEIRYLSVSNSSHVKLRFFMSPVSETLRQRGSLRYCHKNNDDL